MCTRHHKMCHCIMFDIIIIENTYPSLEWLDFHEFPHSHLLLPPSSSTSVSWSSQKVIASCWQQNAKKSSFIVIKNNFMEINNILDINFMSNSFMVINNKLNIKFMSNSFLVIKRFFNISFSINLMPNSISPSSWTTTTCPTTSWWSRGSSTLASVSNSCPIASSPSTWTSTLLSTSCPKAS